MICLSFYEYHYSWTYIHSDYPSFYLFFLFRFNSYFSLFSTYFCQSLSIEDVFPTGTRFTGCFSSFLRSFLFAFGN